jgi:hypothetical protein
MAFVGLEAWLAWRRGLKVYRLHDALTSINIGAMSETIRALLKLLSVAVYALVVERVGARADSMRAVSSGVRSKRR